MLLGLRPLTAAAQRRQAREKVRRKGENPRIDEEDVPSAFFAHASWDGRDSLKGPSRHLGYTFPRKGWRDNARGQAATPSREKGQLFLAILFGEDSAEFKQALLDNHRCCISQNSKKRSWEFVDKN